jgi:hypothetical protein
MKPTTALVLLRESLRQRGVGGTAALVRRLARQQPERRRKTRADQAFDEERGVETARWVRVPELGASGANLEHAVRYAPSNVEEFTTLMDRLRIDHRDFTFVDYGSGKGRVLLLAAEYPFKRIIGVEFAESLVRIARRNVATLGAQGDRIEMLLMDATEFEPPREPLVLYFFHPFRPPVLRKVLERIQASLDRHPRAAYAVVTGPLDFVSAFDESGFQRVAVDELGWMMRGVFAGRAASRVLAETGSEG